MTTPNPCNCGDTTTTTSSTTPPPCGCTYPTFCGEVNGECTYTDCARGQTISTIACTSTTTTCDCNTTTTTPAPEDCVDCCEWVYLPNGAGGFNWQLLTNDCPTSCPCQEPEEAGIPCETSIQSGGAGAPLIIIPCTGDCTFWWIPDLNEWVLFSQACPVAGQSIFGLFASSQCSCTPPSFDGTECAPYSTPCQTPTTQNPCANCYTTSSTTTAAPGGCVGYCRWHWNGSAWDSEDDPCSADCPCHTPAFDGTDTCERTTTKCSYNTTTTTSTTTTTTTTTTTSSTTSVPCTAGCCGNAQWILAVYSPGILYWTGYTNCDGACYPGTGSCINAPPCSLCLDCGLPAGTIQSVACWDTRCESSPAGCSGCGGGTGCGGPAGSACGGLQCGP